MELEALAISVVATAGLIVLHILLCRVFGAARAVRWMFISFAVGFAVALAYWHHRHALNVFSRPAWVTLIASLGFWCLGYMEAFSMLCRGFSLSILVLLSEKPGPRLEEVVQTYGGVGAAGLMRKRLTSIEGLGFIVRDEEGLALRTGWPTLFAWATFTFKRALRLGKGG